MAVNSGSLLLVLTLLVALSTLFDVSTALGGRKAKESDVGFKPLDPKDPKVVEVAKFAIDEYNKEAKTNLTFQLVLKAASKETTYTLIIEASNGSILDKYDAVVSLNGNSKTLVAFKKQ
ncbi:cysteine proteinase inhibitor 1-like [Olea europaea var. sylvestris]|uniref:Cysteine ase inhibitor 1-like n=2 Tax=Olea europaea subsp. europaea TaxID=158383 RepID=A0A8S0UGJ8_OLEEU|nr:cysteine proteinase inhibitor 1-like [Olea europaea var. sylvestris]CAA3017778.1 cysteine ase inhibitor 1-like [Olea europaea subsp. europaea]